MTRNGARALPGQGPGGPVGMEVKKLHRLPDPLARRRRDGRMVIQDARDGTDADAGSRRYVFDRRRPAEPIRRAAVTAVSPRTVPHLSYGTASTGPRQALSRLRTVSIRCFALGEATTEPTWTRARRLPHLPPRPYRRGEWPAEPSPVADTRAPLAALSVVTEDDSASPTSFSRGWHVADNDEPREKGRWPPAVASGVTPGGCGRAAGSSGA